jgi:hypothetical protein
MPFVALPADADRTPVTILRTDAIDAAGALTMLAHKTRREVRKYPGPHLREHRASLRRWADLYEAAAARIQRAADNA